MSKLSRFKQKIDEALKSVDEHHPPAKLVVIDGTTIDITYEDNETESLSPGQLIIKIDGQEYTMEDIVTGMEFVKHHKDTV